MNGILNHFDSLLGASDVPTGRTDTADWTRLGLPHRAEESVDDELDHPSHPWTDSVLDVYRSAGDDSSPLSAIYQMQHADQIIPNLRAILNSSRSNDEIAAELTDLLGFDEIELVMHILDNRLSVSKQLDQGILKSRTPANGTEQHSRMFICTHSRSRT
ncbi:hypothetical protein CVT26_003525 [Gymnopilus dilepis]|uniref:Uncharacterized protein n=1 Tax=Gymnopilus dilepis TaxID=231916 RepID=A0A409WR22_9AGAR|nr:hypothetical protein CVT26_003525 [Gymnopilus dilepis]